MASSCSDRRVASDRRVRAVVLCQMWCSYRRGLARDRTKQCAARFQIAMARSTTARRICTRGSRSHGRSCGAAAALACYAEGLGSESLHPLATNPRSGVRRLGRDQHSRETGAGTARGVPPDPSSLVHLPDPTRPRTCRTASEPLRPMLFLATGTRCATTAANATVDDEISGRQKYPSRSPACRPPHLASST